MLEQQHAMPRSSNNNNTQSLGIELTPDVDCHPPSVDSDTLRRTSANGDNTRHTQHQHHSSRAATAPQTTAWDAWIQLTKAYIGPGCLSLPWAISQLGLPVGTLVIVVTAVWTSYNCWNVVALKRIIAKERQQQQQSAQHDHNDHQNHHHQVTYPDVGEWAYNTKFKDVLLVSICVQQLAVCTVFLSFIGENIAAVMEKSTKEGEKAPSHAFVITLALPFVLLLSCLPNLKVLSPVMVVATISLFVGFGLLGVVIAKEWEHRPRHPDEINLYDIEWSQVPTAVCAILYSYEGICVVIPVEQCMANPEKFGRVFVSSMSFTAVVFATVAALCVVAFGDVTSGSVTAFLVENLQDENVKWWLYMANTACSLAVLLTYPLQLFPSFELIGPWLTRVLRLDLGTHALITRRSPSSRTFSPIPSCENPDDRIVGDHDYHHAEISSSTSAAANGMPIRRNDITNDTTTAENCPLSSEQYNDETGQQDAPSAAAELEEIELGDTIPFFAAFPTPGDSPQIRAILVCFTYIMAIAIPNVQVLVSLAGALSGSATGLIIPPLLVLSNVKRQEDLLYRSITDPDYDDDDNNDEPGLAVTPPSLPSSRLPSRSHLQWKKRECYILFGLGVVICVFGTGAALLEIVKVYVGR